MRTRFVLTLVLAACSSYGPRSVPVDRFDYSAAVGDSWKDQMLLNLVKLRYMDMPVFLDVQQILAGYTLEASGAVGWNNGVIPGWGAGLGGKFTDRPTITYHPLSGHEFSESLIKPIQPSAILFLIQAGYPADLVLPLCVQSINGLRARRGGQTATGADSDFNELVDTLSALQRMGVLGMRIEASDKEKQNATVLFFHLRNISEEAATAVRRFRELLRLDPDEETFHVRYSTGVGGGNAIEMLTRSPFTIMFELATQIDVPEEHSRLGWTVPQTTKESERIIRIRTAPSTPRDTFVAVEYEDNMFFIRKDDLMSFLNLLFSFVERGGNVAPTLVTVQAG